MVNCLSSCSLILHIISAHHINFVVTLLISHLVHLLTAAHHRSAPQPCQESCWSLSSHHTTATRICSCASSSSTAHHHYQQIGIKTVSSSIYIYTCRVYLDQTSTMQTVADCHHRVYIIITSSLYHCRCMCYIIIMQWLGFASQIDRASSQCQHIIIKDTSSSFASSLFHRLVHQITFCIQL